MPWIWLSLTSSLLFSLSVLIDKFIVERIRDHVWGLPVASTLAAFVFGWVFQAIAGPIFPPFRDSIIILLTGMFTIWGGILYFKAMSEESSGVVVVLFQLQPLIVLLLSWLWLGEAISTRQVLGFSIILSSAVALSLQRQHNAKITFRLSPAFWWVMGADLLWAFASVLFKLVVTEASIWAGAALEAWGLCLGGLLAIVFVPALRRQFALIFRRHASVLPLIAFNEILFTFGKFVLLYAIILGPVALVTVLGSTTVIFTLIAERLLAFILPLVYRPQGQGQPLFARAALALSMLAGVWLLQ